MASMGALLCVGDLGDALAFETLILFASHCFDADQVPAAREVDGLAVDGFLRQFGAHGRIAEFLHAFAIGSAESFFQAGIISRRRRL